MPPTLQCHARLPRDVCESIGRAEGTGTGCPASRKGKPVRSLVGSVREGDRRSHPRSQHHLGLVKREVAGSVVQRRGVLRVDARGGRDKLVVSITCHLLAGDESVEAVLWDASIGERFSQRLNGEARRRASGVFTLRCTANAYNREGIR
ncbi:hypothetical protein ACFFX0_29790 [Citricoccus parietis]|uniref:Single-stranded DNA-binding protein n=1 Tax=Citricoccus parietis TaxID=592307 RepID=A0ABV5G327_9MICC